VSDTAIWVPISSAVAALLGGGFGAMLQGRYGVTGWRRQIRLEAYTAFLNAAQDFDSLLPETLDKIDESNIDGIQQQFEESYSRLGSAAAPVTIAGPHSIENTLSSVMNAAHAVMEDVRNRDTFISVAQTWRVSKSYDKLFAWRLSAEKFAPAAQEILKTK
jgi:hypothetical protein